jgi:hypothetical protein
MIADLTYGGEKIAPPLKIAFIFEIKIKSFQWFVI